MTIKIQKLTLWFYILLFTSLNSLSNMNTIRNDGLSGVLVQFVLLLIFSGFALIVLRKRQKAIHELNDGTDFTSLYRHEWMTAAIVCVSNVVDSFFLTNISYYAYLVAVFYHLYWFFNNYSIYSKKNV